jgi:hypothetical protein
MALKKLSSTVRRNVNFVPIIRNIKCRVQESVLSHVTRAQSSLDDTARWVCPKHHKDECGCCNFGPTIDPLQKLEILKAWAKQQRMMIL